NLTAAAVCLAAGASGAVRTKTVLLLTPEEIDEATKKSVDYRPRGGSCRPRQGPGEARAVARNDGSVAPFFIEAEQDDLQSGAAARRATRPLRLRTASGGRGN